MKLIVTVISLLLLSGSVGAQESPSTHRPADTIPGYVEYGDISFSDERAMLDQYASLFRLAPDSVIYIFVFSGQVGCAGEARARAVRAKNYLVKEQGVEAGRVIWRDGGFRSNLSVELWLKSRAEVPPKPTPTVDPTEVTLKNCRSKKRGRRVTSPAAPNNGTAADAHPASLLSIRLSARR